jgi:hypothetical protein
LPVQSLDLQCFTQDEIAAAVGMPQQTVAELLPEIGKYQIPVIPGIHAEDAPDDGAPEKAKREWEAKRQAKIVEENQNNADHAIDFQVPIYNVWKQQTKSEGSEHFGNSEVTWVDRLLYMYTKPFDIVIDPFAGGGGIPLPLPAQPFILICRRIERIALSQ